MRPSVHNPLAPEELTDHRILRFMAKSRHTPLCVRSTGALSPLRQYEQDLGLIAKARKLARFALPTSAERAYIRKVRESGLFDEAFTPTIIPVCDGYFAGFRSATT